MAAAVPDVELEPARLVSAVPGAAPERPPEETHEPARWSLAIAAAAALAAARRRRRRRCDADEAAQARGPITIWYSNNAEEVAWGKAMVAAWNKAHPDEQVTGQEIPTGKSSEEVIGAAITAGNAPCLVFNTSPAAVPASRSRAAWSRSTTCPAASSTSRAAPATRRKQYESPDGKYYQLPWKANPVMIFYNKKLFKKAGIDAENPPLATYDEFPFRGFAASSANIYVPLRDGERRRRRRLAVAVQPPRAGQHGPRAAGPGPVVAGELGAGDADDRRLRGLEAGGLLHPALPRGAAERARGAL